MTFPGNIKGGENARFISPHLIFELDRPILSSSHIFRAGQTNPLFLTYFSSRTVRSSLSHFSSRPPFNTRRAHPIYGLLFSRKSFLHHLFIPPRTTDPWSFKLGVLFLLWHQQLNSWFDISNSFLLLLLTAQGISSQADIKDFETQYSRQLICFLPSLNITKATGLINLVIYCYIYIYIYIK